MRYPEFILKYQHLRQISKTYPIAFKPTTERIFHEIETESVKCCANKNETENKKEK